MLKQLINNFLEKNIEDKKDVSILFSGGMDSLSLLLSCLELDIKPILYTFYLEGIESEDLTMSRKIADYFDLTLNELTITKNYQNLKDDILFIMKNFKTSRKTKIQCIQPFLYTIPKIKEKYVLSGLCADDLYGTMRSMAKYSMDENYFNNLRYEKYNNPGSSAYFEIKQIIEYYNKIFIAPYKQEPNLYDYFMRYSYKELNTPKQKQIMYDSYNLKKLPIKLYRRNSNLQCNSKIREWHDELLKDDSLNKNKKYKSVVGIYNNMFKNI